jgi:shikimate dehydrogenase
VLTRLGVCGWPVGHSLSPAMHNAALAELGLHDWRYQHLPLPPELFAEAVRALPAAGFRGVNVTIPHKEAALALADEATATARAVGAANTLTFQDSRISADNTDVTGLLRAIPSRHDPRGRRALVLGAGGAARAAMQALVSAGAAEVLVHNRTHERAVDVASQLGARAVEEPEPVDIVVQCTSAELTGGGQSFKTLPAAADTFQAGTLVVDMVYRSGGTDFLAAARSRGADVVDGLEILVAQGAASLEGWTGRPAPHDVMRRAVRSESKTS